jgi:hypothetical protein
MVYAHVVKRLQILIDEDLDAELERAAQREGRSKGALVRESLRKQLKPLPPIEQDPIWDLAGSLAIGPRSSQEIDEVLYGPRRVSRTRKQGRG